MISLVMLYHHHVSPNRSLFLSFFFCIMSYDLDLILILHHMTASSHHHTVFIPSSHQNGSISCDFEYCRTFFGLNHADFSWIMKSYCHYRCIRIMIFKNYDAHLNVYWWSRPGLFCRTHRFRVERPLGLAGDTWQDSSWRMHFKEDLTGFVFQAPVKKAQPYQNQKHGGKRCTVAGFGWVL